MNSMHSNALEREADRILIAANDNAPKPTRFRFRGARPAWNWLHKQDPKAAAALWLVARRMLPEAANDNQADGSGLGVDRRKDGKPRGKNADPRSIEAYLALPSIKPRLGDADSPTQRYSDWHSDVIAVKPQRDVFRFHADCRFSFHPPAIAEGASFLGAIGGLGQPKAGKKRGDIRRVDEPDMPEMPDRIFVIIENMLARADLAGIGRALGYKGGYTDRAGGKAMREAGKWALGAIAA